jgi:hypothetical protein
MPLLFGTPECHWRARHFTAVQFLFSIHLAHDSKKSENEFGNISEEYFYKMFGGESPPVRINEAQENDSLCRR